MRGDSPIRRRSGRDRRCTRDIDITPATDQANLERLAAALDELHAAIRLRPGEPPIPLPADARLLARAEILNLSTDAGDLDITNRPDGTGGYDDLKRSAHRQPLGEGLHIAIAALEDIIRSKTAAGRAKDLATWTSPASVDTIALGGLGGGR